MKSNNIIKQSIHMLVTIALSITLQSCILSDIHTIGLNTYQSTEILQSTTPNNYLVTTKEIVLNPSKVETYLPNPGMGWQDGPEPFGFMNFPNTVVYGNRRDIAWQNLNPSKGIYNWAYLNSEIERARQEGKQFSFRIYTQVGEGFDGHKVPFWVLDEGAKLLPSGEPDYSNCVYQEEWGIFVNEIIKNYDGNPNIAFIDISGYGNFNEWSWDDNQTQWDELWDINYQNGTPLIENIQTIDGQARRRLADMFIGGSINGHACRLSNGIIAYVDYSYDGFKKTQLLMPFAGIVQSTQYVNFRRNDIGFRYDCLGKDGRIVFEKIGNVILDNWKNAPVVYELCKPSEVEVDDANWLLQMTHASIVHNNQWSYSIDTLEKTMMNVGYQFFLKEMKSIINNRLLNIHMDWQNTGYAPYYPKMGHDFQLNICLLDKNNTILYREPIPIDISTWLPAEKIGDEPPTYGVSFAWQVPNSINKGEYFVGVSIIDLSTGKPIRLAFNGNETNGIKILFEISVN